MFWNKEAFICPSRPTLLLVSPHYLPCIGAYEQVQLRIANENFLYRHFLCHPRKTSSYRRCHGKALATKLSQVGLDPRTCKSSPEIVSIKLKRFYLKKMSYSIARDYLLLIAWSKLYRISDLHNAFVNSSFNYLYDVLL